ncbi:MAG: hypothetical protein ACKVPX_00545 [Myxococcaceae bacterium]
MFSNKGIWVGAALMVGCNLSPRVTDEYLSAIPDESALQLEVTGDASETAEKAVGAFSAQAPGDGNVAEFLHKAREKARQLNQGMRSVAERLFAFAENHDYTQEGNTRTYGPALVDGIQYQLVVTRVEQGFRWHFDAAPEGATEFQVIATGGGIRGDAANRGRGVAGFDLDKLAEIDTDYLGAGKLFASYAHSGENKVLGYRAREFTPNSEVHAPVTAAFLGSKSALGVHRIRLAGRVNLDASATPAEELVRIRVRFKRGVGGRADLLATSGDVPENKVWLGSACWDAVGREGFKIVRECERESRLTCTVLYTVGQLSNCAPDLRTEETPTDDPSDVTPEPDAPVAFEPVPDAFPTP